MPELFNRSELIESLQSADQAHHQYEISHPKGKGDPDWAGWYAGWRRLLQQNIGLLLNPFCRT